MANQRDEVLLDDPNDSEFSGFGPADLGPRVSKKKDKKGKKPLNKSSTSSTAKNTNVNEPKPSSLAPAAQDNDSFDIEKLSEDDIEKLRQLLGFGCNEEENIQSIFGDSLPNLPNLHIELTEDSEGQLASAPSQKQAKKAPLQPSVLTENLIEAMFEPQNTNESFQANENDAWDLPKLKIPEKGAAVSQSLANLINTACSSQCVTDNIVDKYKVPENCDKLSSPLVIMKSGR